MGRVRLRFARGVEVEFVDRGRAIAQINEIAERGTYPVYVVYGPEGCGKTALLRQAKEILEEHGYSVVYVDPLAGSKSEALVYTPTIRDIVREAFRLFPEPYSRIVDVALNVASLVMRRLRRPRIAILVDDLFQAIGVDKAERYVKTLLNMIEHPPGDYEKIAVLVTSSEGLSRESVGRHSWATLHILWNMSREGFRELYNAIPGSKPGFEYVWMLVGGNPRYLGRLYEVDWSPEPIINEIVRSRGLRKLIASLDDKKAKILEEAVNDPDTFFERISEPEAQSLEKKLVELNMIIEIWERDEYGWFDTPPPEKDLSLGIGRYYAWQTPLHREAVKRTLHKIQESK